MLAFRLIVPFDSPELACSVRVATAVIGAVAVVATVPLAEIGTKLF